MTNSGHVPQMDSRWGLWGAWLLASSHQSRMEGHASPDVLLCGAHTLSMQGSCWTLSKEGESYKPLETTYGLWADSNLRPRLEDAGHSIGQCAHFNKGREGRRETDEARGGFKGRAFEPGWQVNSYLRHSFSFCTALKICFMNNSKGGRCPGHSPSEAPPPIQGWLCWGYLPVVGIQSDHCTWSCPPHPRNSDYRKEKNLKRSSNSSPVTYWLHCWGHHRSALGS